MTTFTLLHFRVTVIPTLLGGSGNYLLRVLSGLLSVVGLTDETLAETV